MGKTVLNGKFLAMVLAMVLLFAANAWALHTPLEWYEYSPLDSNHNKLDDRLDRLASSAKPEVFLCFRYDCRPDSVMSQLLALGAELGYQSPIIASAVIRNLTVSNLQSIVASWSDIGWIVPNDSAHAMMSTSGQAIKAHSGFYSPNTAQDRGITGAGTTIAIFDTGVKDIGNGGHPDLPPPVGGIFVTGALVPVINLGNPTDQEGHGTQVAGVALGRGQGATHTNKGVAPAANLFDCRITLPGPGGTTSASHIQAAIDWLTLNNPGLVPQVNVANISFGFEAEASGADPLTASIDALVQSGVVVCVAAGNNDNCPLTSDGSVAGIGMIAVTPRAITVAAATDLRTPNRVDDAISDFSRHGTGLGHRP